LAVRLGDHAEALLHELGGRELADGTEQRHTPRERLFTDR
jgi:hypothetical protein